MCAGQIELTLQSSGGSFVSIPRVLVFSIAVTERWPLHTFDETDVISTLVLHSEAA
jgi:hypothetical protein